jgi:cysteinyl-tRNA synthetase
MNKTEVMNMSPNDFIKIIEKKDAQILKLKSTIAEINENIKIVGKQNDELKRKCDRYEKRLREMHVNDPIYHRLYSEALERIDYIVEELVDYGSVYYVESGLKYYYTPDGEEFTNRDDAMKHTYDWLLDKDLGEL